MKVGSYVKWKLSPGINGLSREAVNIRIEDHGSGPFKVLDIDDFLNLGPGSRLISFMNENKNIAIINEGFLEEI